jgi:hypothetical protein
MTMYVLWLNFPLAALIFLAVTAIPLWLVIRHPDTGPAASRQPRLALVPHPATPAAEGGDDVAAAA